MHIEHLSRLCHAGYTDAALSGDGVSDRVLTEVARKAGPKLTRCKVQSSSHVTDTGLTALVAQAKDLETLELEDLSKQITGEQGNAVQGLPCREGTFGVDDMAPNCPCSPHPHS